MLKLLKMSNTCSKKINVIDREKAGNQMANV